jgi:hypothetical protein
MNTQSCCKSQMLSRGTVVTSQKGACLAGMIIIDGSCCYAFFRIFIIPLLVRMVHHPANSFLTLAWNVILSFKAHKDIVAK